MPSSSSTPMIKVQLLVSEWCSPCRAAEDVWRKVADRREITFEVLDMAQPEARALAQSLRIRTIPALIINGELRGLGVQTMTEALELVKDAPARAATAARFVGITLELSSRAFLVSAAFYLVAAGIPLVLEGSLIGVRHSTSFIHFLTLGFITFTIYGLGEHMLPRFTGNPVRMGAWPWMQLGLAHAGAVALAAGWWVGSYALAVAGGVLAWLAMAIFSLRTLHVLWRT